MQEGAVLVIELGVLSAGGGGNRRLSSGQAMQTVPAESAAHQEMYANSW